MAEGKTCPSCGWYMYAEDEVSINKVIRVNYKCRNKKCGKIITTYEEDKNPFNNNDKNKKKG